MVGLICMAQAQAQIYVSGGATASASSSIVLSNFKSDETPVLLVAAPAVVSAAVAAAVPAERSNSTATQGVFALPLPASSPELKTVIEEVAAQLQIAPGLLHAVIAAESRYDIRAVSPKGAMGLMQLMPATAKRFGVHDAFRPRDNVFGGASYLKWLMALFDNDLELVLAAYNAGENAVIKAGRRVPPYPETQAYVPRVLAYLRCAGSAACKRT